MELKARQTQKKLKPADLWQPQNKQADALRACGLFDALTGGKPKPPIAEMIGYGGAAFGGKSDADLGIAITACLSMPGINVGYFRRTFPELSGSGGAVERSREILTGSGVATYNEGQHVWRFTNGSTLRFCHCQNEADVYQYKSNAWDILIIDEATTFTWFQIDYLLTRNRPSTDGTYVFCLMTTNPGDIGHAWFSQVFDCLKTVGEHNQVKNTTNPNGKQQSIYFIPAFLEDNPIGLNRDPGYEARLMARDPVVANALRYGDWSTFSGQAFTTWNYSRHVYKISDYEFPDNWMRWRALDYGFTHPFACYWFTKSPDSGRVFVVREAYQSGLTDRQQARLIKDMTLPNERIGFTFASPDMWNRKNTQDLVTTAADEYAVEGVPLTRADNDRLSGKRKIDRLLADLPDSMPGILVSEACRELIKLFPNLVRDKTNPEDVLKMDNDDPYDALRYGLTNTMINKRENKKVVHPFATQRNI